MLGYSFWKLLNYFGYWKNKKKMWFALQDSDGEGFMDVEIEINGPEPLGRCWSYFCFKYMMTKEVRFIQNNYFAGEEKELNGEYLVEPDEMILVRIKTLQYLQ